MQKKEMSPGETNILKNAKPMRGKPFYSSAVFSFSFFKEEINNFSYNIFKYYCIFTLILSLNAILEKKIIKRKKHNNRKKPRNIIERYYTSMFIKNETQISTLHIFNYLKKKKRVRIF